MTRIKGFLCAGDLPLIRRWLKELGGSRAAAMADYRIWSGYENQVDGVGQFLSG